MPTRDLVVVGASAGGVEALTRLAAGLPSDFPAAIVVVLHLPPRGSSALAAILDRAGPLRAMPVRHGQLLTHGTIHVAPPDHHTLVMADALALSHGPTESGHRPAVDALFRSAAVSRGPAVTGVQLSGVLDDGVAGLVAIADRGGRVVVQHPDDALFPAMPRSALRVVAADHVAPVAELPGLLGQLVRERVDASVVPAASRLMRMENEIAALGESGLDPDRYVLGPASGYSCPDCQGSLAEVQDLARYRCRTGHSWTAEALLAAQGSEWERALWTALRLLEETACLASRMADTARARGSDAVADRHQRRAEESITAAATLREHLTSGIGTDDAP
ncbi:chemotaxis protein CheB [Actinokineospora globicatena]|uniref:chemotaxis protein CheB n=1 Tax=Actinokineospora globicatena TaxID=103729 RepID=UPI0020A34974|nr:chemotaxis protein CheB [Actinokineospora globicatena]MCP2303027.1 two-component system, chemotaxis family, response regulator CheB [Actinokineospora globicatena]